LNSEIINQIEKNRAFRIAFIGRIEREKNLKFAIELLDQIKFEEIKLYILGDGTLLKQNMELVNSLKLYSKIEFLGHVKNAASYLRYFDLLLITSHSEGIPFVMWEAMANAVPILSSNVGGIPEIVEKENFGLVFQKNNLNDAVVKLSFLMNNNEARETNGE